MTAPLLEVRDVSKFFGNVIALKDVSVGGRRRRGHVRARRQRRRQVDASSRSSPACTRTTRASCWSRARRRTSTRRARREERGIATVFQDLATVPLMSVWRNFFLGSEPTNGQRAAARASTCKFAQRHDARGDAQDGHRRARPGPAGRHAVGRRAPGGGDRPRRLLRREGADPRRADVGARRQAVRRRAALHRAGARPRARRDLHHPQPAPRVPGRRSLRDPQPRPAGRRLAARARSRRDELVQQMSGGAELDAARRTSWSASWRARDRGVQQRRAVAAARARAGSASA